MKKIIKHIISFIMAFIIAIGCMNISEYGQIKAYANGADWSQQLQIFKNIAPDVIPNDVSPTNLADEVYKLGVKKASNYFYNNLYIFCEITRDYLGDVSAGGYNYGGYYWEDRTAVQQLGTWDYFYDANKYPNGSVFVEMHTVTSSPSGCMCSPVANYSDGKLHVQPDVMRWSNDDYQENWIYGKVYYYYPRLKTSISLPSTLLAPYVTQSVAIVSDISDLNEMYTNGYKLLTHTDPAIGTLSGQQYLNILIQCYNKGVQDAFNEVTSHPDKYVEMKQNDYKPADILMSKGLTGSSYGSPWGNNYFAKFNIDIPLSIIVGDDMINKAFANSLSITTNDIGGGSSTSTFSYAYDESTKNLQIAWSSGSGGKCSMVIHLFTATPKNNVWEYVDETIHEYENKRYVRYEKPDGTWTNYELATKGWYKKGSTVPAWARPADATYAKAEDYAYVAQTKTIKHYISVYRNKYSIVFNKNGADSGSINDMTLRKGKEFVMPSTGFLKKGYKLASWNTKSDGSGTKYTPGSSYTDIGTSGQVITLYAQWQPIEYKIYYSKGLTSDVTSTAIDKATRKTNIQLTGINRPYTQCKYDNSVTFATIGDLKGRAYTIKYDSNKPNSIVKQKSNNSAIPTTVASITGTLPSKNMWQISGQESAVNSNLTPTMGSTVAAPNYLSTSNGYVNATAQWNNKTLKDFKKPSLVGWKFVGWYDNSDGNDSTTVDNSDYTNTVNTSVNMSANNGVMVDGNITQYVVKPKTTAFTKTLYARWQRTVHLKFDMNGGQYQGSSDDVVLTGIYYNDTDGYNFSLTLTPTAANLPDYEIQQGIIDAYGVYDSNGENGKYIKIDDEVTYRFLGWSLDPNAKEPDTDFISFANNHKTSYKIYDDTTFYAVWEPVLNVDFTIQRTLGTLNPALPSKVIADASTPNPEVAITIRPGEQAKYEMFVRGNADTLTVDFDERVTKIYDNKGTWTDNLNPNPSTLTTTVDGIDASAKHGLNRVINLDGLGYISKKFYIPQYLGTTQSEPSSRGIDTYTADFVISNKDSFYYKYVLGKAEGEQIKIKAYIYLPIEAEGEEIKIPSVLDELRTRLKIRLH